MIDLLLIIQTYVVPFIYAIGLIYFIYGFIEYFLIGKGGDEERMQHGRELFINSCFYFIVALVIYGAMAFALYVTENIGAAFQAGSESNGGVRIERERGESYLNVPNVPGQD